MQLGDQDDLFLVSCSPSFDIHYSTWVVSSRPIVTVGFVSQPSVSYTTTHDASSRLRTVDSVLRSRQAVRHDVDAAIQLV